MDLNPIWYYPEVWAQHCHPYVSAVQRKGTRYTLVRAEQKCGTSSALWTNLCKPYFFVPRTRFGGNGGADLGSEEKTTSNLGRIAVLILPKPRRRFPSPKT